MGDAATGQQPFDAQEVAEDEANAGQAEDAANAEQEPEAQAKSGPPPSGSGTQKDKPDSKFHG